MEAGAHLQPLLEAACEQTTIVVAARFVTLQVRAPAPIKSFGSRPVWRTDQITAHKSMVEFQSKRFVGNGEEHASNNRGSRELSSSHDA